MTLLPSPHLLLLLPPQNWGWGSRDLGTLEDFKAGKDVRAHPDQHSPEN